MHTPDRPEISPLAKEQTEPHRLPRKVAPPLARRDNLLHNGTRDTFQGPEVPGEIPKASVLV